ncbi:DUF2982 domain-containing protein [Thalassotalea ganghwensis]
MDNSPHILIAGNANKHGRFALVVGVFGLFIVLLLGQWFWQDAKFPLMFAALVAIVTIVIGASKLLEPRYRFDLTPQALTFIHRKGCWSLPWSVIRNIYPITNTHGIVREELGYIGIRVEQLTDIANNMPPRLANHLLHEQKPLLLYCVSRGLAKREEVIINFESFKLGDKEIKGPLAGFLHQCVLLHRVYGAHLFIAQTDIDRSMEDFTALLKNCKAHHQNY